LTRGTVLLTDSNGAVTDTFAYGPYGEGWCRTGSTDTPFRFNGRYGVTTEANGLLCMRARFYHPILRRFLNQDVLLGSISPGIALNRYAFANGRECPCRS
jgi:RHS repeat-associated protein